MNPYTKTRWTLLAALLIWAPVAFKLIAGSAELWFAGAVFLGALAIAFIGVEIIAHLSEGYARTGRTLDAAKRQIEMIERKNAAEPQRRKDDLDRDPPPDE